MQRQVAAAADLGQSTESRRNKTEISKLKQNKQKTNTQ